MEQMTPDEIAHATQNTAVNDKNNCPHYNIVDQQGLYICLDCGMESRQMSDFK
ncbi:hypothetical protein GCM10007190_20160 [Macrococcus hajekii]|uniref:hypothetical protein n=1 Tax=Macrococcus hajekii TaxID=198482 RepID=UPI00140D5420|nr:hypothetical protein [Macrococcus hajekii]GGB12079.1 hypothetical protein GCM10007190_20160 [Macrococcus hajekii]